MLLSEKRSSIVKDYARTTGITQRSCIPKEEASCPAATAESVLIISAIGAKEEQDAMIIDILKAFIQIEV